uniref:Uncharacterized protein n=1 Tax=Solanum lycopersicum TaxID=4081 RepID=A0A3Q7EUL9_SOLLC
MENSLDAGNEGECLKQGGLQMGKSGIEPHLKVQIDSESTATSASFKPPTTKITAVKYHTSKLPSLHSFIREKILIQSM